MMKLKQLVFGAVAMSLISMQAHAMCVVGQQTETIDTPAEKNKFYTEDGATSSLPPGLSVRILAHRDIGWASERYVVEVNTSKAREIRNSERQIVACQLEPGPTVKGFLYLRGYHTQLACE